MNGTALRLFARTVCVKPGEHSAVSAALGLDTDERRASHRHPNRDPARVRPVTHDPSPGSQLSDRGTARAADLAALKGGDLT
jgi:hypothetical protein